MSAVFDEGRHVFICCLEISDESIREYLPVYLASIKDNVADCPFRIVNLNGISQRSFNSCDPDGMQVFLYIPDL